MGMFGKWLGGGLGFVMGGPIGGLLGFLVGSVIDGATQDSSAYTSRPARTTQGDFGMSLLVLVAAVMKADGKVVKSELDYVKQFFVRQFGQESAKEAASYAQGYNKAGYPGQRCMYSDKQEYGLFLPSPVTAPVV